jgi:hypothetical protein
MISIAQRAAVLRCAASAFPKNEARKLLEETADVLEAQAAAFNSLYACAIKATQEGQLENLRAFVATIEQQAKSTENTEKFGSV